MHTHTHTHTHTRARARAHTHTHTRQKKKPIYITNTEKESPTIATLEAASGGDRRRRRRRRRRRPDATESTGSLRLRCHPQVSPLSIASCQLELRPSLHRQLLSSPPVVDVDRDRLWGDGLAASSPVGLCRKFRWEDSQKARLERKRLQQNIATSNIVSMALWGFDRQPRGSLFIPCSCGAPAHCGKVVPSCKLTGRLPIERKPADNVSQKKRSPPHSPLSSTARFSLSRCLHTIGIDDGRGHIPIFLIHSAANNQQNETLTS